MPWKGFLSFLFSLIVVGLLLFYWILPVGEIIEFGVSTPGHSNFTLNNSLGEELQFYQNMRYKSPEISYGIENCSLSKTDEMMRAFELLEESTILSFYEVSRNEEISITCEDTFVRGESGAFIVGEGGVTRVISSGDFSIIFNGKVLLLRETQCANPIVGTHELLHSLGFDHSDNPNNIMYPTVKCHQTMGDDIPAYIDEIYSIPSHPDLTLENVSASMQGIYLDVSFTIRNNGLEDAGESLLKIYAGDDKKVKELEIEPIPVGSGRIISLSKVAIPVVKKNTNKIELFIDYGSDELSKNNNRVILEIKN